MSFPEMLCVLMENTGTSNVRLGKAVGVSDMAVARWKKGEVCPSLDNALAVANYFSISLDELVGNKQNVDGGRFIRIPIIGTVSVYSVDIKQLWADEYLPIESSELMGYPREECFALAVRDDTVSYDYTPGLSYLIFHQQKQCASDELVLVEDTVNKEILYRKFTWQDGNINLLATEDRFKNTVYTKQQINRINVLAVCIGEHSDL